MDDLPHPVLLGLDTQTLTSLFIRPRNQQIWKTMEKVLWIQEKANLKASGVSADYYFQATQEQDECPRNPPPSPHPKTGSEVSEVRT